MQVFGTDYPTADGTCIRDYIHVCDLVRAHCDALAYLRGGGISVTLNCGYGHGFSVLEVIETVKRVSGADFKVEFAGRRAGDPVRNHRRFRARPLSAQMAALFRQPANHCRPRAGLGAQACDARRLIRCRHANSA